MFRIRHAAKMAGITPGLLRAWERRYHLVEPTRTESGYRVYSPDDVALLTAAARLVGAGHSISEIARLDPARIRDEAAHLDPAVTLTTESSARAGAVEAAIAAAIEATARFDRERFEAALLPVLALGGLPPAAACEEVLMPLLRAIGDAWERGELSVAAEHFGSSLVRAKALQYLQLLAQPGRGPKMVCACPEQERHEGGLIAFAVHAAASGWDVVYLGATTPLREATDTAVQVGAEALALSLTLPSEDSDEVIASLGRFAAAHPRIRVILGGRLARERRPQLESLGLCVAEQARIPLDDLRPTKTLAR